MKTLKCTLAGIALLTVGWLTSPVIAQDVELEVPPPIVMQLRQGLLCETLEEVEVVLSRVAMKEEPFIVGKCQMMRGAVMVKATALYWYENPDGMALLTSYETRDGSVLYGMLRFIPKTETF